MKNLLCLIIILFYTFRANAQVQEITVDGKSRTYRLHIPDNLAKNAPLVFVFHGYSGSAAGIENYAGMNAIADKEGFAVCYPQGLKDQWNNGFWQVGYSFHSNQDVDDVKFARTLASFLQAEYNLSTENTFCTGMSNGGDMSYLLACQAPDVFAASAPVAGCMMEWIYNSCGNSMPIPVLEIHGTNDDITFWSGDINDNQGYGAYMGVPTSYDFWVDKNECTSSEIDTLVNINTADGSYVITNKSKGGVSGNEVWLYTIKNGGHDWPGSSGNMDINSSEVIWSFFKQTFDQGVVLGKPEKTSENFISLQQNYPNPFSSKTTLSFEVHESVLVSLKVYNLVGNEVIQLINEVRNQGSHSLTWDATDSLGLPVASGTYLLKLEAGKFKQTKKIIIED